MRAYPAPTASVNCKYDSEVKALKMFARETKFTVDFFKTDDPLPALTASYT